MSKINNNERFWKNRKPVCRNKVKGSKTITFVEGNEVITDDGKLAHHFGYHFFPRE